ncbi:uncharacterized protein J4E88_002404 [Alternaria novae-zelandiae]|uniref:uncharacterized protein n=1 Tax=Alternaria novae-zelandiae TaxID=430562 RepID=UPI0020C30A19|nr:uncharacterized protein J4E88_002404 [Alternaria novae-zelandiae]KAI4690931.1 hypothetical protein J4E88_002404 [Alternaria novae-zelandiae]
MSLDSKELFSKSYSQDILRFTSEEKCTLINSFWPQLNLSKHTYNDKKYASLLNFWGLTLQSLHPPNSRFATEQWGGLLAIVGVLRSDRNSTRRELVAKIESMYFKNFKNEPISGSIELAVQLWLGIHLHSNESPNLVKNPMDTCVSWADDQSLEKAIAAQFSQHTKAAQSVQNCPLDTSFTAMGLKSTHGMNLLWTDSLVDHLKLEGSPGNRRLFIYRHKTCLVNHRSGSTPPIISADILDEAIRTLDLLFPVGHKQTIAFLKKSGVQMWIENPSESLRATELNEFVYWRSRLAQLLNLLNSRPETVLQAMKDTRHPVEFVKLWGAVFGVFLLTILFGVLSTVYSAKQYNVAVDSYQLALAQACCQQTSPLLPICAQSTAKLC